MFVLGVPDVLSGRCWRCMACRQHNSNETRQSAGGVQLFCSAAPTAILAVQCHHSATTVFLYAMRIWLCTSKVQADLNQWAAQPSNTPD
jgi:hypothetical protein